MTSLAAGSAVESATVANNAGGVQALDFLVSVTFRMITGTPVSTGPYVNVYANGSTDGTIWPIIQLASGAPFTTGAGNGSVGALSTAAPNLRLIGSFGLQTITSNGERTFRTEPMPVANAFGGIIPPKFSIIVENQLGIAFSASTDTTHTLLEYQPIYTTSGN